jgi:hypothetical protein
MDPPVGGVVEGAVTLGLPRPANTTLVTLQTGVDGLPGQRAPCRSRINAITRRILRLARRHASVPALPVPGGARWSTRGCPA